MGKRRTRTSFQTGAQPGPGRPRGVPNRATREIRDFARRILEAPDYERTLKARIMSGEAQKIEALLYSYAYGRPPEAEPPAPQFPIQLITRNQIGGPYDPMSADPAKRVSRAPTLEPPVASEAVDADADGYDGLGLELVEG